MIRLVVRIDDAAMAAHVGGSPQTTYRTFDIEALLRGGGSNDRNDFSYRTLVGAEIISEAS